MVIYKIVNLNNGKAYIGLTKNSLKKRFAEHASGKNRQTISKEIKRIGKENFRISKLDIAEDKKSGLRKEKSWITKLNTWYPHGYNRRVYSLGKPNVEIICLTNRKEYYSAKIASSELNIDSSSIIKCCRGKQKQTKGYFFQYKEKKSRPTINKEWLYSKTSKYIGVSYAKKTNKWIATIHPNRESIHLGCFDNEKDAHKAYLKARRKYFGKRV